MPRGCAVANPEICEFIFLAQIELAPSRPANLLFSPEQPIERHKALPQPTHPAATSHPHPLDCSQPTAALLPFEGVLRTALLDLLPRASTRRTRAAAALEEFLLPPPAPPTILTVIATPKELD